MKEVRTFLMKIVRSNSWEMKRDGEERQKETGLRQVW